MNIKKLSIVSMSGLSELGKQIYLEDIARKQEGTYNLHIADVPNSAARSISWAIEKVIV